MTASEGSGLSWRYLAVASEAVLRAGGLQRERYASGVAVEYKGEIDLVTEVDRACELSILETIRGRYPDHDIVTEETDLGHTGSRFVWFIDPLDGTVNFAHSYPFFCASVALALDGEIVAGAVYDPLRDELFSAERGAGAHVNGPPAARIEGRVADREPADHRLPLRPAPEARGAACASSTA
jgi:myo-inositol-1(or 4)-monophosphatase